MDFHLPGSIQTGLARKRHRALSADFSRGSSAARTLLPLWLAATVLRGAGGRRDDELARLGSWSSTPTCKRVTAVGPAASRNPAPIPPRAQFSAAGVISPAKRDSSKPTLPARPADPRAMSTCGFRPSSPRWQARRASGWGGGAFGGIYGFFHDGAQRFFVSAPRSRAGCRRFRSTGFSPCSPPVSSRDRRRPRISRHAL